MSHPLRYVFHSHAAAFGGRIVRPKDIVLEAGGASALLVTGGRSVAQLQRTEFDEFFVVESANTLAEGFFEDKDAFIEVTHRRSLEQTPGRGVTRADGSQWVGHRPETAAADRAYPRRTHSIEAQVLAASRRFGSGRACWSTVFRLKAIDWWSNSTPKPYIRYDTHAKLLAAMDDPKFVSESGEALFMSKRFGTDTKTPAFRKLLRRGNTLYATIVKSIRWVGKPFPKSEIHDNMVVLPTFGRVFFGELLIADTPVG